MIITRCDCDQTYITAHDVEQGSDVDKKVVHLEEARAAAALETGIRSFVPPDKVDSGGGPYVHVVPAGSIAPVSSRRILPSTIGKFVEASQGIGRPIIS